MVRTSSSIAACIAFALTGCMKESRLEPAPAALMPAGTNVVGGESVVTQTELVSVKADVRAWRGDRSVLERVTPVRVTIENRGDAPLRIQYSSFALVAPSGEHFAALPPFRVEGLPREPAVQQGVPAIASPQFEHSGFAVAPYLAPVYPNVTAYQGPFDYDPVYYDTSYGYWGEEIRPTEEMTRAAIPEGVLEPQGRLGGFLYFQKVEGVDQVNLTIDLVDASTGTRLGRVSIPFRATTG
jgi:hypothetical protein